MKHSIEYKTSPSPEPFVLGLAHLSLDSVPLIVLKMTTSIVLHLFTLCSKP